MVKDALKDKYKKLNREPQKTYKGVLNVIIDPELHKKIYKEALKAGMSLNAYIQKTLQNEVLSHS